MNNIDNLISTYSDEVNNNEFSSIYSYRIKPKSIKTLESEINRVESIFKINSIINNSDISHTIENSIFEYTLIYSRNNDISDNLMYAIYNDKLQEIIININPTSFIKNNYLYNAIMNNEIDAKTVGFLTPDEIFPDAWRNIKEKREYRRFKEENMASTDMYKCYKCGERKCKVSMMQTRGADEPMTTFISCLVCGNIFKK